MGFTGVWEHRISVLRFDGRSRNEGLREDSSGDVLARAVSRQLLTTINTILTKRMATVVLIVAVVASPVARIKPSVAVTAVVVLVALVAVKEDLRRCSVAAS